MLRPACHTAAMPSDALADQIRDAHRRLESLRPAIEAGAPWPLAARFDHAPEAEWGPPEVLAHLAEMVDYWHAELARVGTPDLREPVPFGRIATDSARIAMIGSDRSRPPGELLDQVATGLRSFIGDWTTWSPARRARIGLHPARGEVTVGEGGQRFIADHLLDHVGQLETVLGVSSTGS